MIKPLGHQVLLREIPHPKRTVGGIAFPDSYVDPVAPTFMTVVAVGPAVTGVAVGESALLDKFASAGKHPAGEGLWLVRESEISMTVS